MKLLIDGKEYELDGDFFVSKWFENTLPYINPDAPEGKKWTDVRLGAKALLRLHLSGILKMFAQIFHLDDWRALQPKRGEDVLVVLHSYMTLMMRAEMQNLTLEMESTESTESEESEDDSARLLGADTGTRLTLTRASFGGTKALYDRYGREDAQRQVGNGAGPHPALSARHTGSGLVSDADAPEIR